MSVRMSSFISRMSSHMGLAIDNKTIGAFGSVCLIANNITGPAMVGIATAFAQAGWLPTTLFILFCGVCSLLSSAFLSEAIYAAKNNRGFVRRIELTDILKEHGGLGRPAFLICFWSFILLFISQNIASIVESAQTSDQFLVYYAGKSCALEIYPSTGSFRCVSNLDSNSDSPFGNSHWVLSLGFLLTFVVVLPLSFLNLDDNIVVQNLSFIGLVVVLLEWVGQFVFMSGLVKGSPPVVGDLGERSALANLFGPVLFNYAYILTLPSWLNEKKPGVTPMGPATMALAISTVMFVVLGWTAASADYDTFNSSNTDITSALTGRSSNYPPLTKVSAFIFPPVVLWSGIPVFAIVVRYNLISEGLCNPLSANMIAAVFPWALALVLYSGTLLDTLTTWAGLLLIVPLNFVLPCYLYIRHRNFDDNTSIRGNDQIVSLRQSDQSEEGSILSFADEVRDSQEKAPSETGNWLITQEVTENDLVESLVDGTSRSSHTPDRLPVMRASQTSSVASTMSNARRAYQQKHMPSEVVDWQYMDLKKNGIDIAKAVIFLSLALNLAAIVFSV